MASGSYWSTLAKGEPKPAQDEGGLLGNLSGALDMVKQLPAGAVGLAGSVGQSVIGAGRLAKDIGENLTGHGEGFSGDYGTNLGEYFPVLEQFRQSGVNTAEDIRHPSRLVEAYQQGKLAPKLTEDIGNVALLGGVAAKGLTAASGAERAAIEGASLQPRFVPPSAVDAVTATRPGLLSAAERLQQASTLGADTAFGAPALPYRLAAGGARRLLSPAAARLADTAAGQTLRDWGSSLLVTPETKPFRDTMFEAQQRQAELTRPVLSAYQQLDQLLPDPTDQRAFYSHLAGDPTVLAPLADQLPPEQFNQVLSHVADQARIDITPEAAQKAVQLSRRKLPADELARFDQAAQVWRDQIAQPREQRYLGGYGESTVPSPERLASRAEAATMTTPLSTGEAPARFRNVLTLGHTVASGLDDLTSHLDDPTVRSAIDSVKGEVATTLDEALGRGADPSYFPGGRLPMRRVGEAPVSPMGVRKLSSERVKETAIGPRFNRGQAVLDAQRIRDQVSNDTARQIAERMGVKAADHLDLPEGVSGAEILTEMQRDGLTPWDPAHPFTKPTPNQITADTVFVPKFVDKGFSRFRKPAGDFERVVREVYDRPQRVFKAGVLALSPRWHVGNIVGNELMANAGGVSPLQILRHYREGLQMTRDQTGPAILQGRGLTGDESAYLRGAEELATPNVSEAQPHALGRLINKSYAANEFVDNLGRNIFYIAKKAEGYSDEAAVKSALATLGDFQKMLPWERQVVRRIFPFEAWTKHITSLAFRLARDQPMRVAWTLHLGDLFQPGGNANDIGFLQGAYPTGGNRFIPLSRLSPFDTAADVFDPTNIGGNLSPLIKTPFEAATGYQIGRPGRNFLTPLSSPPGTGTVDEYGHAGPVNWLTDPGSALYRLSAILPQTRLLRDYVGPYAAPVARYDTGEPIQRTLRSRFGTSHQTLPQDRQPLSDLGRLLGLPVPQQVDVEAIRQSRAKRLAALAKSRAAYESA